MKQTTLNFGVIRDTIYNFSSKELIKEGASESTVLKKFLQEIKESPILKLQFLIYKNIENGHFKKERLAERYLNQNLNLVKNYNWLNILSENKRIRLDILKDYHAEAKSGQGELYENIHTLIESVTKKDFTDINKSEMAYDYVVSYLLKEESEQEKVVTEDSDMPKLFSWKFITDLAVSNFNERYKHLNENERDLLKILLSTESNKTNYAESLKSENLNLIKSLKTEHDNYENTLMLETFERKINSISHTSENIDDIIINYAELNETLKSI